MSKYPPKPTMLIKQYLTDFLQMYPMSAGKYPAEMYLGKYIFVVHLRTPRVLGMVYKNVYRTISGEELIDSYMEDREPIYEVNDDPYWKIDNGEGFDVGGTHTGVYSSEDYNEDWEQTGPHYPHEDDYPITETGLSTDIQYPNVLLKPIRVALNELIDYNQRSEGKRAGRAYLGKNIFVVQLVRKHPIPGRYKGIVDDKGTIVTHSYDEDTISIFDLMNAHTYGDEFLERVDEDEAYEEGSTEEVEWETEWRHQGYGFNYDEGDDGTYLPGDYDYDDDEDSEY